MVISKPNLMTIVNLENMEMDSSDDQILNLRAGKKLIVSKSVHCPTVIKIRTQENITKLSFYHTDMGKTSVSTGHLCDGILHVFIRVNQCHYIIIYMCIAFSEGNLVFIVG